MCQLTNLVVFMSFLMARSFTNCYVFRDYPSQESEEFTNKVFNSDPKINFSKAQDEHVAPNVEKPKENPVDLLESFLLNFNRDAGAISLVDEISSDNLLERLSEIHKTDYSDYAVENDTRPNQVLSRREISDPWQSPVDIVDTDVFPWSYDSYYPREPKYIANDYVDYSNVAAIVTQPKNATAFDGNKKHYNKMQDELQIPRNNYYSDYGPRGSYKNYEDDGFEDFNRKRSRLNLKKYISKNPCRQYLEFLKYAFEKLDEASDDYENEHPIHNQENRGREKIPPNFAYRTNEQLNSDNLALVPSANVEDVRRKPTPFFTVVPPTWPTHMRSPSSPDSPSSNANPGYTYPKNKDSITTPVTPLNGVTESYSSMTKETVTEMYSTTFAPTESPTNLTPRLYFEGKEHGLKESNYRTTQENYQNFERTTAYSMIPGLTGTAAPRWMFPENYYKNLGNGINRTSSNLLTTTIFEASRRNFEEMTTQENTTPTTSKTSPEDLMNGSKKNDSDCNDKMLPCPDTYNITYPLNGYCNRYVSCESGRAVRRTCPEGLHFNLLTKSCDLPHNSFCNYACSEPDGYYGIPGDCGGYFICENGVPEYRMCPPRMHWDTTHDVCTFVELSKCPMKCTAPNQILHYKGDCKAYIICLNGLPYYHKCPPNTKFDRSASTCVPEHLSKCEDDPKLMTQILNPNYLCKDVQMKFGTETWCDYYKSKESPQVQ